MSSDTGKFEAAVEPFIRNDISPENKEQLSTLLNDIWGNISTKIKASRKLDDATFQNRSRQFIRFLYARISREK